MVYYCQRRLITCGKTVVVVIGRSSVNASRRLFGSSCRLFEGAATVKKKDVSDPFPVAYNPKEVEAGWYGWWVSEGFFRDTHPAAAAAETTTNRFTMVLPPPNVTGDLHVGHALAVTIEDVLQRWHRSKGDRCLWVPGFDHAGIATQVVVEKKLKRQGSGRHELGREAFLHEVRQWSAAKTDVIRTQLQKLGASLDWSREAFTMDDRFSRAVNEAFVRLHESELLTRRRTLVNWCCSLQSTISDMEVEHVVITGTTSYRDPGYGEPVRGVLTHFAYPLEGQDGREVVVATTRPETMFGDVAVAVNPNDERFRHLEGGKVIHPFDGRRLPVVFDDHVDPKFGTGCLKLTPGHSHEDFALADRHGLPVLNVLDEMGCMVTDVQPFCGMNRFAARKAVVDELKRRDLFRGQQEHEVTLPICSRSGGIVEPLLKSQWFLRTSELIDGISRDLQSGKLTVAPRHAHKDLSQWLSISRDSQWCLSRQLWWGHQIPAYRLTTGDPSDVDAWIVARSVDEAMAKASKKYGFDVGRDDLVRESDVLDTWFSSALFPFVVFGWPDNGGDLSTLYPISLMETGRDILFFWVVRMLMLGKQLTGVLPFSKILAHGLVCDGFNRKMSKSMGNVVDPSHVIDGISLEGLLQRNEEYHRDGYLGEVELKKAQDGLRKKFSKGIHMCGADALRFALCAQDIKDQTVSIDVAFIRNCHNFCNKLWQASRFYLASVEKTRAKVHVLPDIRGHLSRLDRWILSQVYAMVVACDKHLTACDLHLACRALRNFWFLHLCDVYVECTKPVFGAEVPLQTSVDTTATVLRTCIRTGVVAISPFLPFLSEELYQRLRLQDAEEPDGTSVCTARYPSVDDWKQWHCPQSDALFDSVTDVVHDVRSFRNNFSLTKGVLPEVFVKVSDESELRLWSEVQQTLEVLGQCRVRLSDTEMPSLQLGQTMPIGSAVRYEVSVRLEHGFVDAEQLIAAFEKDKHKLSKAIGSKQILESRFMKRNIADRELTNQLHALGERLRKIENYLIHLKALK